MHAPSPCVVLACNFRDFVLNVAYFGVSGGLTSPGGLRRTATLLVIRQNQELIRLWSPIDGVFRIC